MESCTGEPVPLLANAMVLRNICSGTPLSLELWVCATVRFTAIGSPRGIQAAYCAMPLPNDQFSFLTSTRLMNTSSTRIPGDFANPSAIDL
jgi:hypothetical protein